MDNVTNIETNNEYKYLWFGYEPKKWWNNYKFPLVPIIQTRKASKHNLFKLTFNWLFFEMWTLDHFAIELSFVMDTHWGIGIIGIIPYLRIKATIPLPLFLERFISHKLSR